MYQKKAQYTTTNITLTDYCIDQDVGDKLFEFLDIEASSSTSSACDAESDDNDDGSTGDDDIGSDDDSSCESQRILICQHFTSTNDRRDIRGNC